ncbi:MAG: hypothetical protein JSS81_27775 [Acidobacteria bacterium]|nr:hypothetical protein [Acidobacteriota bacterium]
MNDREIAEFDSAVRMIDFNQAHAALFHDNARMADAFAALQTDVAALEAAGANRLSAAGASTDGTADKRAAKAALYALVRKTVATARTIKLEEPGFDNQFKIRRGTLSGQEILAAARSFAGSLTRATVAKFAEYGAAAVRPDNFASKIAAYETARAQQNAGRAESVAATGQTRATIAGLKKTRRTIARIGENILEEADAGGLLAAWQSACRVERAVRAKRPAPAEKTES